MSIVFDFDGVIVDSRSENIATLNALAAKYGYEPITLERYTAMTQHNFYEYWQMLLGEHAKEFFTDIHMISRAPGTLLPGMKEILLAHTPIIVSSNATPIIKNTLSKYDIALDVYGGDIDPSKVRKLGKVKQEPAIFVTDTPGDVHEGKIAGYTCIAVTWGFAPHEMLIASRPEHIVHTPQELHELLLQLRGLEKEIELFR